MQNGFDTGTDRNADSNKVGFVRGWAVWITAVFLGILPLLLAHTRGRLIYPDLLIYLLPLVASAALAWVAAHRFPARILPFPSWRKNLPLLILCTFLLLYLCSSATRDRWFYFLSWRPVYDSVFESGLFQFALLTLVLTPLLLFGMRRPGLLLVTLLVVAQVACFFQFFRMTDGGLLYRNDHPSFLFRLHEFARNFPQAVNYLPQWNAGRAHCYSTTSGTPSIGLFYWPLWRFLPVHSVYTAVIGFSFIGLGPWLAAAAVRLSGARLSAAAIGGLLFLGLGHDFFRWAFDWGTVAGVFSLCFLLPFAAGVFRAVWFSRRSLRLGAVIVFCGGLLLLWPPAGLLALALGVPWMLWPSLWNRNKWLFLAACAGAILILCGRWFAVDLFKAPDVTGYFRETASQAANCTSLWDGRVLSRWLDQLSFIRRTHPLIVYLGIAAAFVSPFRSIRRWYPPVFLVLLAGVWFEAWEPRLQLDRLLLPLTILAVIPAAIMAGRLLRTSDPRLAPVRAALLALLVLGSVNQARLYANRGQARTHMLDASQQRLIEVLSSGGNEGRVLFAGAARQAYGDGQVAYLPVLTGREMMALDYYHFPDDWTDSSYPPPPFNENEEYLFRFINLYNVTDVVAYDPEWIARLRAEPGRYTEGPSVHYPYGRTGGYDARVFRVLRKASFLMEGRGQVKSDSNRLQVSMETPLDTVVLRYHWADGLRAQAPVEIFPVDVGNGIRFIGVKPHGQREFDIRFHSRL